MDKQNLIIFKFKSLCRIFEELEENLNFKVFDISDEKNLKDKSNILQNYLIVTKKKIDNINNQFILNQIPIKFSKLIENLNIQFLKIQYSKKSEIVIGKYKIDLNSRKLILKDLKLKLTEKEINILIYLFKSTSPIAVDQLQFKVWGHHTKLETHTVETHIYRLRKKILKAFNDDNFIISQKNGYQIK